MIAKRYIQHVNSCSCGKCNNTGRIVEEKYWIPDEAIANLDSCVRMKRTLEHITKGRCANPKQCAQECLDGDIDPDYGFGDEP